MIADYEGLTGEKVMPASPERMMIAWVASIILKERIKSNYAANQNLPSRANGDNLDALAELLYSRKRPEAKPAVCTMRFYISEAQASAILIPAGTRVTDRTQSLYWQLIEDAWIPVGSTYVDAQCQCQTAGTVGNGFASGTINIAVDVYDYYSSCENTAETAGGSDRLSDADFYELLRTSMDSFSTAGAKGSYIYHAKATSSEIADVVVNSPMPGEIRIYILNADGSVANATLKQAVYDACNADDVRPLTDHVVVEDPEEIEYDIDITYYIIENEGSSAEITKAAELAVDEYVAWQQGKLGRDINPSKLISALMAAGVKRVEVASPSFVHLRDGNLYLYSEGNTLPLSDTVPQIGKLRNRIIRNGGVEDD